MTKTPEEVTNGPPKATWRDVLSGTYYSLTISAMFIGLVVWTVKQEGRISNVEQAVARLEKIDSTFQIQINSLEEHGTRALSERVGIMAQTTTNLDQRIVNLNTRLTEHESILRKVEVLATRQEEVFRRLNEVERRIVIPR